MTDPVLSRRCLSLHHSLLPPASSHPSCLLLPDTCLAPRSLAIPRVPPHRPSSLSCPSLSLSPHNQLPINIICSPSSMQTCSVRCSRPHHTVPGWRCSCPSSFASRLIQRLHAGSPSLCRSLGTAIFAPAPSASVMADARSATLDASASLALVLADARSAALNASAPLAPVLADARSATINALAPSAPVLALPGLCCMCFHALFPSA